MQKLVFINGNGVQIDLTAGKFGITNWAGLSNTSLNIQTQQVPFEDGGVFLDALMEQREIELTVAIYDGNNLELRYQKKRELISALNPKLGEGTLIYTNDYLSRQIKAVPQIPLFENKNSNDAGTLKASVAFSCPSPYWEDLEETEISFDSAEQPIINNTGDVPCQITMEWFTNYVKNGSVTNLTKNQKIKYNGITTNDIKFVTEIGKKSVISERMELSLISYGSTIKDIVYAEKLSLFVAIGPYGLIMTSKDGRNWNIEESPTTNELRKIIYSNDKNIFVCVSTLGGQVLYSNDGKNWNMTTTGTTPYLRDVAYSPELELFIIVGDGTFASSSDGINWTAVSSGRDLGVFYSSPLHMFVSVGYYGAITTSTDGIHWTSQTSGTNKDLLAGAYSEYLNLFVVCGGGVILASSDGINWTIVSTDIASLEDVTYSTDLELFVAISSYGDVYTSRDGINWSKTKELNWYTMNTIIYVQDFACFFIGGQGYLATTNDCINFNKIFCYEGPSINDIIYSKELNMFVAVGTFADISSAVAISSDGKNWITNSNNLKIRGVAYSAELNLFIGVGTGIKTSSDAINWTAQESGASYNLRKVIYSKTVGLFVAVGNSGKIVTSSDGINWTEQASGTSKTLNGICYSEIANRFIVVGNDGLILTSSDGINWSTVDIGITTQLNDVKYHSAIKKFIITGNEGFITISNNGLIWQAQTSGTTENLNGLCVAEELKQIMTVGNNGTVLVSTDGINWNEIENTSNFPFYAVCYSGKDNLYVIAGEYGNILNTYYEPAENMIQNISMDSDLNMNLGVGENKFRMNREEGNMIVKITYRQKYIGV